MHRKEWCLDDYIITDKLYKGYASMGELQHMLSHVNIGEQLPQQHSIGGSGVLQALSLCKVAA
jgi:hypothetical protein